VQQYQLSYCFYNKVFVQHNVLAYEFLQKCIIALYTISCTESST